jgi:hypothetical protein
MAPVLPAALLPVVPSVDEPLTESPAEYPESDRPPVLVPELSPRLPPDKPPDVPPILLPEVPPDVAPLFAPPKVLSVALRLVPPADDALPPVAAPLSSGVGLVEADEELAPPDVSPLLCSALPPSRLQPARLIVNSPRINSVFDLPRLDLITIPFESGCVNLWLDQYTTHKFQCFSTVSVLHQRLKKKYRLHEDQ